jgi:hypothetical protein
MKLDISIIQDTDPVNPRCWDNYGVMACSHRKYTLGDEDAQIRIDDFNSWDEVEAHLINEHDAVIILPLYLYDHSGITMSTTSFLGRAQHASWDSGQVGFIYTTREKIFEMQGWKRLTKERKAKVEKYLVGEVATYEQYLTGDVYGYSIKVDGEEVESCWSFFGEIRAREEAAAVAVHHLRDWGRE